MSPITRTRIRWRLHDPIEDPRRRWSLVHVVSFHNDDVTVCHRRIPELPYDTNRDEWIPADARTCKQCERGDD